MGVSQQGVYGNWSQRTGNVVARQSQGRTIYSIYQPKVSNPKTNKQETVRMKFRLLTLLGARLRSVLSVMFANLDGYDYGTWLSSFIGFNFRYDESAETGKKLFSGEYPNISLVMANLQLSPTTGSLPGLLNASADIEGTDVNVTWTDDTSSGNGASAMDKVSFIAYNPSMRSQAVFIDQTVRRSQMSTLSLPVLWAGGTVEFYAVVRSASNDYYSPTMYLGQLSL